MLPTPNDAYKMHDPERGTSNVTPPAQVESPPTRVARPPRTSAFAGGRWNRTRIAIVLVFSVIAISVIGVFASGVIEVGHNKNSDASTGGTAGSDGDEDDENDIPTARSTRSPNLFPTLVPTSESPTEAPSVSPSVEPTATPSTTTTMTESPTFAPKIVFNLGPEATVFSHTKYENNEDLVWIFTSPINTLASVDLLLFDIEQYYDFVYIHDGITNKMISGPLTGQLTKDSLPVLPGRLEASSNIINVRFVSDDIGQGPGFVGRFQYRTLSDNSTYSPTPPTLAPSIQPSTAPTSDFPTTFPTTTPPTHTPTKYVPQTECEYLFAVLDDTLFIGSGTQFAPSPSSDLLISTLLATNFSAADDTDTTIHVTFRVLENNRFGFPQARGQVTVDKTTAALSLQVELDESSGSAFYLKQIGGVAANAQIQLQFADPSNTDSAIRKMVSNDVSTTAMSIAGIRPYSFSGSPSTVSCASGETTGCSDSMFMYFHAQVCSVSVVTPVPTVSPTFRGTHPTQSPTVSPTTDSPLVQVVFTDLSNVPTGLRASFTSGFEFAAEKWNSIISNTLPVIALPEGLSDASEIGCPELFFPKGTRNLTGLIIFASVGHIDDKGGTLAQASACAFSSGDGSVEFGTLRPRVGWMNFDEDDLSKLVNDGNFDRVVLHEVGHVLGIGVLWGQLGLVTNPPTSGSEKDPRYVGVNGMEGYEAVGGIGGESVPVANTGGGGTELLHWREETFEDELMTGFATGANTLSLLTILSLRDLGYTVDPSMAEEYVLPGSGPNSVPMPQAQVSASKVEPISLGHDVVEPRVIGVLSNDGSAPRFVPVIYP